MINIKTIFNVIRKYLNKKNKKAKKTQWWRNSDMIAMQYTIVALVALRNGVQDEIPKRPDDRKMVASPQCHSGWEL